MNPRFHGAGLVLLLFAGAQATAETFTNIEGNFVDFPAGAVSFADELVEFSPVLVFDPDRGTETPLPQYLDGTNTLGVPDYDLNQALACDLTPSTDTCRFVSLGQGGSLTVRFVDNLITGSDSADPDIWIFQAGPADEAFVDISADGQSWIELGAFQSLGNGIDLDLFGFGRVDRFAFLRIRDNPATGQTQGDTLGPDIDAIGAISTVLVPVPAGFWLLASALGALGWLRATQTGAARGRD
jgi:hypothetical protein